MKLGRREKYQPIHYCLAGCLAYPVHTCHLPIDIQQIYCSAQTGQHSRLRHSCCPVSALQHIFALYCIAVHILSLTDKALLTVFIVTGYWWYLVNPQKFCCIEVKPDLVIQVVALMGTIMIIAACERGDLPELQRVLEETQLDVRSEPLGSEGETALHVACAHGHLDIVQYLVNDRGCSVAAPNSRAVGATPLEVAWANKHWEVVEFLLNTIKEDILPEKYNGLPMFVFDKGTFYQFCICGYFKLVKVLTEVRALRMSKQHLQDGLFIACTFGQLNVALYLTKEKGCDLTLAGPAGVSPLQQAWRKKHWRVASHLVQAIQEGDFHCTLSLSHAGISQFLEIASFGEDALHIACSQGFLEAVHFLHEILKCSLVQSSSQGEFPLTIARSNGHLLVIQFLLKNGTCTESDLTEMHVACITGNVEKVRILSSNRTCLRATDNYGMTPVHYASCEPATLKILVSVIKQEDTELLYMQDGKGNTPLHYAVITGCEETQLLLLSFNYNFDLNIQNIQGNTALHEAVKGETLVDVVEVLILHKGCSPSKPNHEGITPLQISAYSGKMHYVKVLVTSGKCSNEDMGTLLHEAVSLQLIELFLAMLYTCIPKFNVNVINNDGETLLHVACKLNYNNTIMKTLVEDSRYDLNAQTPCGDTALHLALSSEQEVAEKVQCILQSERCNPNITNSDECTPLHVAVKKEDSEAAVVLLNHSQCNPNIQDLTGNTPLHMAIGQISLSSVESFLNHKNIDLNIQNIEGNTPLHEAVMRQAPVDVVEALALHKGCNPSIVNNAGMTPLKISAMSGDVRHTEVLINSEKYRHEDIVKVAESTHLLHQAILSNRPKLALRLIIDQVCNINETNSVGETALHVACRTRCDETVLKRLVKDGRCDLNAQDQSGSTALHLAVCSTYKIAEKVQCMLQSERCDPNITNSEGHTPLHVAVKKEDSEAAVVLLNQSQCNPNIQDLTGNTPLHMAIGQITLSSVESFLNHKNIDLNIQNREGNTPLHEAVMRQVAVDVVEALALHKGCNPSIANNVGMTPLNISATSGDVRHAEVLITSERYRHEDIVKVIEGTHLLHQAILSNRPKLALRLIIDQECNINETNSVGETALHVACRTRCDETVLKRLAEDSRCDLNAQDQSGNTALHLAVCSTYKIAEKVQCVLQSVRCDPNITNSEGYTPLHKAVVKEVPLNVMEALVLHKNCNPNVANLVGLTPLQMAVDSQQMDKATVLINSKKCSHEDIVKVTKKSSLIISAVYSDNIELLINLLRAGPGVDINTSNSKGETALHIACKEGKTTATKLLLQNEANLLAVDRIGNTPIHVACAYMRFECLDLLLGHHACNPNQQNVVGETPLHMLCSNGKTCDMRMLCTLLSTPGINPECANHLGQTPAELADSNYSVIEMISKYLNHKNTQIETYLKIFVVGNSGGGKSTLIKAVTTERSKSFRNSFRSKHVNPSEVPPHTAGIVPLSFNSKHFGHAVLYDFAGQHEYYSSHAAVMENLVLPSPPLFLLLIDISKPMNEIKEELVYWWMFINNHSKRATAPPHVILVGSHKDIVKENGGNISKTMERVTNIVRAIPVSFQFDHSKAFPLDCRKLVSQGLTALLTQLKLTCKTLRQAADIDLHCHIMKAFLATKFSTSVACEVSVIKEKMKSENVLLPQQPSQLIPLLSTLSDKGHILLLENRTEVNKSWVVLKPELLLAEVNGSIFAPENFKGQYNGFAMSTGVVPLSKIGERFGEPNKQVIIGYLTHLEFCFQIKDKHTLEMITKDATPQLTTHSSEHSEEYYFFPSLIWRKNPSDVCQPQETIKYECGWLYRCNEPTEQLTTRFLHVLILRLAFSCDPPDEPTERESVVLLRSCSVWKHGIAWWTNDGIETIVEVGLQCRWVAVMLRCPDTHKVQCAELRTKVISTVLKTKQDFCPAITMKEFLIAPSSLQYPFEGREHTLYSMKEIAKVVIAGKEFPKDTEGRSTIHISQLLPFEPFFNFGENLVDSLFTPGQRIMSPTKPNFIMMAKRCYEKLDDFKKALNPDQFAFQRECVKPDCTEVDRCVALFQIIQRRGCKTWRDFEEEFSRFSVFCGRNPMVSEHLMV